ncbi:hypothetical protein [Micromonospora sonneratiae]|uniref:Uncharacterized protein n=1 Tax=Micromonospora sonneratiae TaxID=1184706 RepID=A0ABW3YDB0_9ACTN
MGPAINLLAGFFWEDDSQGIVAGTLIVLSSGLWLIGLIGLYDRLKVNAPRYVAVALPVAVFATVGGLAFGFQGIYEGLFDVSHAEAIVQLNQHPLTAVSLYWIPGPLFPATLFALGFMVARLRHAPRTVGVLIMLGALAFPLSRITREPLIAHVADVLLLLPFLYLGVRSSWPRRAIRRSEEPSVSG